MKYTKFLFAILLFTISTTIFGQTDDRDKYVGTWRGTCPEFIWHKPYPNTDIKLTITKASNNDYGLNLKITHDTKVWTSPLDVNLTLSLYRHLGKVLLEKTQRAEGENMFIVDAECFLLSPTELKVRYQGKWMHDRGAGLLDCKLVKID